MSAFTNARANNVIVAIKLVIIVVFIVAAAPFVTPGALGDSRPIRRAISFRPISAPAQFGLSGVVRGAAVVFFAYIGFDAVSTAAQEAKNPKRDMPIGILGSLALCTVLYVAVGFVLTGIVPYDKLNVPDPIAVGIDAVGLHVLAPIIKLGVIFGLTSVILVMLLAQPRIFYSMARDGLLPPAAGQGASALSHALYHHDRHRRRGDGARRPVADRPRRRTRQHRYAVRVRHRLRRRVGVAHHAADLSRLSGRPRSMSSPRWVPHHPCS